MCARTRVHMRVCTHMYPHISWCLRRSGDSSVKSVLSFYLHTGSESSDLRGVSPALTGFLNTREPLNSALIVDPLFIFPETNNLILLRTILNRKGFPSYLSIIRIIPVIIKIPVFNIFISRGLATVSLYLIV